MATTGSGLRTPAMSWVSSSSSQLFAPPPTQRRLRRPATPRILSLTNSIPHASPVRSSLSDPFVLEVAEKLEDAFTSSASPPLQRLRESSSHSLLSKTWPSSKQESFRFTDTSFLRQSQILPACSPSAAEPILADVPSANSIVLLDGRLAPSLSRLGSLPPGAYAGSISGLPTGATSNRVLAALEDGYFQDGDVFWDLNGVGAPDVMAVYVPPGARLVDDPLYIRFCSAVGSETGSGTLPVSNPRVIVVVEKGAEVVIIEEHLGVGDGKEKSYWANSVMEIVVAEGGKVSHSYVQRQSRNAAHVKWTFARQETSSSYELVDISSGARLSRHNLHIQQLGPDTMTELSSFHLSQSNQVQDLHSRLILDHPRGSSRQKHKSIVTHSSGQVVFDGNIKVNRFAQQTDAGQLTRTLLLAPKATANIKPNLQIVADDVKCSHGAAISDLEDDQLFYFQARGIDLKTARDALIFSFGAEVIAQLHHKPLREDVTAHIKELLAGRESSE